MIYSQAVAPENEILPHEQIIETLHTGLDGLFQNQRVLVLIPDHTRSLPLPFLFRILVEILHDTRQLGFMVALGTHPPLSKEQLNKLIGITSEERISTFKNIRLLNHAWDTPSALMQIGTLEQDEIQQLAGEYWHESLPAKVDIRINRAVLEYDHILILAPTFPHEVAGFSGGAKYLFPGVSGPQMIHATHWLGALAGVVNTIGIRDTPVRAMIHEAAARLTTPVTLIALVMEEHALSGLFIGDLHTAWSKAADLSAQHHIRWHARSYQRVFSAAPSMYDELWTCAKAMYKVEPAAALGGEVIIYAPHLDVVSRAHGRYIYETGYHILPYFLEHWGQFRHIPLGVLAHSTHLRGSGRMENRIEKPNVKVTLASKISAEDCARLNLGYLDPLKINIDEWKNREDEDVLFVARAGEILHRVKLE